MKTLLHQSLGLGLALGLLLLAGCASVPEPGYNFLERSPVRVAILPSVNKTDQPGAQIVVDKAWEQALKKAGFEVVSADRVMTYVGARGMMLTELANRKAPELGKDLKVDLLLKTEIRKWEMSAKGGNASTTIEAMQRLVEAPTDAVVWEHHWFFQEVDSNQSWIGMMVDMMVNAATDNASKLGTVGVLEISAKKLPRPGHGPVAKRN